MELSTKVPYETAISLILCTYRPILACVNSKSLIITRTLYNGN